jgi:hypothetical protein
MPFIGIIAKESESNFIKNEVTKNSVNNKFEFININKESIQNIKNIKFDIVVINNNISDFLKSSKYLENVLKSAKYLIVNSDVQDNTNIFNCKEFDAANNIDSLNHKTNIITYGLNQHAMITISSIKNENILLCIQKSMRDINDKVIEQQEVNIEITKNSLTKTCNSMVIFTILTLYGEFLKKI